MGCSIDDVPVLEVLGQLGQVSLFLLPCMAILDVLAGANNDKRRILVLDLTAGQRISPSERTGDQTLLQFGKDELAILLGRSSVYSVAARSSAEDGTRDSVQAEWGDNAPEPENESSAG